MGLTKRDKETLDYIKRYMKESGMTPTIREIGKGLGLYSTSSVHNHVQRLIDLGYMERISNGTFRYKVKGMRYVEDGDTECQE